jgi:hypothetical protein
LSATAADIDSALTKDWHVAMPTVVTSKMIPNTRLKKVDILRLTCNEMNGLASDDFPAANPNRIFDYEMCRFYPFRQKSICL